MLNDIQKDQFNPTIFRFNDFKEQIKLTMDNGDRVFNNK
jgi:hypothetical protein